VEVVGSAEVIGRDEVK
jgi:lipoate synthase